MIAFSLLFLLGALGLLVAGLFGASQALIWGSIAGSVAAGMCLLGAVLRQRRTGLVDYPGEETDAIDMAAVSAANRAIGEAPPAEAPPGWVPEKPTRFGEDESTWPAVGAGHDDADSDDWPDRADRGRHAHPADYADRADLPDHPAPDVPAEGERTQPAGGRARHPGADEPTSVIEPPAGVSTDDQPPPERPDDDLDDPPDEPAEEERVGVSVLQVVDPSYEVMVVDGRPRYHLVDCPHLVARERIPVPLAEAHDSGFTPCALCRPDSTLIARTRAHYEG